MDREYVRLNYKLVERLEQEGRCFSSAHKALEKETAQEISTLKKSIVEAEKRHKGEMDGMRKVVREREKELEELRRPRPAESEEPQPRKPLQAFFASGSPDQVVRMMTIADALQFFLTLIMAGKPAGVPENTLFSIECSSQVMQRFDSSEKARGLSLSFMEILSRYVSGIATVV